MRKKRSSAAAHGAIAQILRLGLVGRVPVLERRLGRLELRRDVAAEIDVVRRLRAKPDKKVVDH